MSLPQALVPEHLQRPWGLLEAAQSHAARGGWAAVDPARAPAAEPCRKVLVGSAGGDRSFRRVLARLVGFAPAAVSNRVGASLAPPPAPPSACGSRTGRFAQHSRTRRQGSRKPFRPMVLCQWAFGRARWSWSECESAQ